MTLELKNVKVGQRQVIASITNLIVPAGEQVEFNVEESGSAIAVFRISFDDTAAETSLAFETKDSIAELTFKKWNDVIRALTVPLRIGADSEGRNLSILVSNVRVGSTNLLSIQFMVDGVSS